MQTPEPANPEAATNFGYQQPLPNMAVASSWRPLGAEGYAQIQVPQRTPALTLTVDASGSRVLFPVGIYIVPKFISGTRWRWDGDKMIQVDSKIAIAGDYDEPQSSTDGDAMNMALRAYGVKRSGQQPVEESEPAKTEAGEPVAEPAPVPPGAGLRSIPAHTAAGAVGGPAPSPAPRSLDTTRSGPPTPRR